MAIPYKRALVEGKLIDVVSHELYGNNKDLYANQDAGVEMTNPENGETYVLPYRCPTDGRPGIYDSGCISFQKFPKMGTKEEKELNVKSAKIIDYSNAKSIGDIIEKQNTLRNIEGSLLNDVEQVFYTNIGDNDAPEMKAFKEAVNDKKCDISKYQQRFGGNFLNDRRLFKGESMTLKKITSIADKLDIEVELTFRDKSPDVPNPIGREISTVLTGGVMDDDE